ncbi:MAG: polymer-forming cytoskeletal protein [Thermotogae bacterium]|nr:polymer-forming cytoskeletal protein [Thermotogota bacterium]
MFRRKPKNVAVGPTELLVGRDTKIVGDVIVGGSAVVDGEIEGNLKVEGELWVGEAGKLRSQTIEASSFVCAGEVRTEVLTAQRVVFKKTARFEGNIRYKVLIVEEGATLKGSLNLDSENVPAPDKG